MYVFIDEVWSGNLPFRGLGSLWVPDEEKSKIEEAIEHLWRSKTEIKWNDMSKSWFHRYLGLIDIFIKHKCWFSVMIIDSEYLRNKKALQKFHQGNRHLFFYKMHYWLIIGRLKHLKSLKEYPINEHLRPRIDYRDTPNLLNLLQDFSNYLRKSKANPHPHTEHVLPVDSRKCRLIQLTDVLLGSTLAKWNFLAKPYNQAQHKRQFIQILEANLNLNLSQPTPPNFFKFNIWLWTPRK